MKIKYSNPCSRCGKERVVVKIWQEKMGYSVVTTTETACPDRDCQKIVEKGNQDRKDKFEASKHRRKLTLQARNK